VCTPLIAECEERVASFLARRPDFAIEPIPIDAEALQPYVHGSAQLGARGCLRTWTHAHECDSHFAAKMRRRAGP
tara:strand:- start:203 stop:427 length:225 start_codon:yes stop_codon:yes gene_type:complete